jgi:hypothetical protein
LVQYDRDDAHNVAWKAVPDLFLETIRNLHQQRAKVRAMTPDRRQQMLAELGDDAAAEWVFAARDAQLPPPDLGWLWLFLGGRGTGKTHAGSSAIHLAVRAGLSRIHAIAPTTADVWDVLVEGSSGLMKTYGAGPIPQIIRCPSSDDLRQFAGFRKGGSGSSVV